MTKRTQQKYTDKMRIKTDDDTKKPKAIKHSYFITKIVECKKESDILPHDASNNPSNQNVSHNKQEEKKQEELLIQYEKKVNTLFMEYLSFLENKKNRSPLDYDVVLEQLYILSEIIVQQNLQLNKTIEKKLSDWLIAHIDMNDIETLEGNIAIALHCQLRPLFALFEQSLKQTQNTQIKKLLSKAIALKRHN